MGIANALAEAVVSGADTDTGLDVKALKRLNRRAMKVYQELQQIGEAEAQTSRLLRAHHSGGAGAAEADLAAEAKAFALRKHKAAEKLRKLVHQMADLTDGTKIPASAKRLYDELQKAIKEMDRFNKKGGPMKGRDEYKTSDTFYVANLSAAHAVAPMSRFHELFRAIDRRILY